MDSRRNMDFGPSPFVRSLSARLSDFLQVLLTDFSLKRLGEGSVLSIDFNGDTQSISTREAKHYVKSMIPDFEVNAERIQKELDDFLVEQRGFELDTSRWPAFPFRYGSGGALPVLHLGGEAYYCLFFRDVDPIGWNIANGGTDTLAELLDPIETMHRELREELLIFDPKRKWRYVFADDYGKPFDLPEFAVARQIMKEKLPRYDYPNFKEIELPLKWDNGPDELRIRTNMAGPRTVSNCFLNINAKDFGIEVDRVAHLSITEDARVIDGEIIKGHLLDRPLGLFRVDEMNEKVLKGETSFRPRQFFHSAILYDESELEKEIDKAIEDTSRLRTERELQYLEKVRKDNPYSLCPVTQRIIHRYAKLQKAAMPLAREADGQVNVFLSFANEDSSLARKVCEFVENKMGRVVFFSEQDKNPLFLEAIFKALGKAKCLIAVATRPDHLEKNWPYFEWTNFLVRMLDSEREKLSIIPFIQGFTPKELPPQFRTFRAVQVERHGLEAAFKQLGELLDYCCR